MNRDIVYLLTLTVALCVSYFIFYRLYYYFFKNSTPPPITASRSLISLLYIAVTSIAVYIVSYQIPNEQLGNRLIHAIGGGFLTYIIAFLAVKDSRLQINKTRFFIFTFLLVMTLGVFNEIVEFFLQNYFNFQAAPNINDTWLDLISNTVGILLAAAIFTPFLGKSRK
jgi:hypothetical protein